VSFESGETARLPPAVTGVTMEGEWDKEVSKVGAAKIGTNFAKLKEEKQNTFDIRSREFEKYT
jgi:hypothetical protein